MRLTPVRPVPPPPPRGPQQSPPPPHMSAPLPIPVQRKSNNTGLIVALVLVGVALFGIASIGAIAASVSGSASDYDSASQSSESSSTDTSGSSTESSSEESTTSGDSSDTRAQPVAKLGDNPVNVEGNGAQNTSCNLPSFDTDVASQDAFYRAALPCLMQAWTPALRSANLPVEPPQVVTTGNDIETPCGTRRWNQTAMYCPGSHTIYMTARYYAEVEERTDAGVFLGQFAHEFGHAIQGMSGINSAYGDASYDAGGSNTDAGLELTRRSELQATCFEGMSLAALQNGGVSNEYIYPALDDSAGRGDEHTGVRDHGSLETNYSWVQQGFTKNRVTECNTWLASPDQVD